MSTDGGTGSDAAEDEREIVEVFLEAMKHPNGWARLKKHRRYHEIMARLLADFTIKDHTRHLDGRLPWGPLVFPGNKKDDS